jgi:hypothetical protein
LGEKEEEPEGLSLLQTILEEHIILLPLPLLEAEDVR